jgi:uncharacterized protein YwqG
MTDPAPSSRDHVLRHRPAPGSDATISVALPPAEFDEEGYTFRKRFGADLSILAVGESLGELLREAATDAPPTEQRLVIRDVEVVRFDKGVMQWSRHRIRVRFKYELWRGDVLEKSGAVDEQGVGRGTEFGPLVFLPLVGVINFKKGIELALYRCLEEGLRTLAEQVGWADVPVKRPRVRPASSAARASAVSEADLDEALTESPLSDASEAIRALAVPQWYAAIKPAAGESPIGASKVGGLPDLPAELAWPSWRNGPLDFLAQVNLADIAGAENDLPSEGLLSFFYDADAQPWGFEPGDLGGAAVVYSTGSLVRRDGEGAGEPFPERSMRFELGIGLPTVEGGGLDQLGPDEDTADAYAELLEELYGEPGQDGSSGTWLLGCPCEVQGEMSEECALVTGGLSTGTPDAHHDPRSAPLREQAHDWRLLFQLASIEDAGMMWGDMGFLYFWIRKQDLEAHDFSATWTILQCF